MQLPKVRFTLLDGTVLVAVIAIGLTAVQRIASLLGEDDLLEMIRDLATTRNFRELSILLLMISLPIMAILTITLVPLRLFKPRPRFRRLACQPGLVAGLAAVVATGLAGVLMLGVVWSDALAGSVTAFVILAFIPLSFGLAVVVAWTILISGARWRPEPSWIDRLGRALGVFWIIIALAFPFIIKYY